MTYSDLPRVPHFLVGGIAELPDLFAALGRARGLPREEVEGIIQLLPEPIKRSPCFLDRLTGLWRYDFGMPFVELPGDGVVLGTHMYHEVDRLYDVLFCARRRLGEEQLSSYLNRLADPNKHEDMLTEFAPILRLDPAVEVQYEVSGYGEGNRTVDWLIRTGAQPPLLLDVKNRRKDLLESLVRIHAGERDPAESAPMPAHDPSMLFASIEQKFNRRPHDEMIQGVWIHTSLKQEETELETVFGRLDAQRVHFAILGDWNDDVCVLARDSAIKNHVLVVLRVRESRRFVFRRDSA